VTKASIALILALAALCAGAALAPAALVTKCPGGLSGPAKVRPKVFSPAGHGVSLDRLHWSRWGARKAVGGGRLLVYDNITGAKAYSRTRVILDRASGGLFHRARWRYSDGRRGSGEYSDGVWVIQQ